MEGHAANYIFSSVAVVPRKVVVAVSGAASPHCPSLPGGITDIANFPANVETAGGALAPRDFFVGTLVVA